MSFRFHPPSKELLPFVQGYLEADYRGTLERGEHTLFPNGFSGIFFNFGNTGGLIIKEEYRTPAVSVFGQIDRHFVAIHHPGFYSLGVLLKPTVLSCLLKVDMSEFANRAFDGTMIHPALRMLHEKMEESFSFSEKIKLFEDYFISFFMRFADAPGIADHALSIIHKKEFISIQEVAAKINVSQRHLETTFKRAVGISPKTYSLIVRFKRIERQLNKQSTVGWQHLEFAHEYHDQNHFIKEFKRFTGHTPSDYLLKSFAMGRSYLCS